MRLMNIPVVTVARRLGIVGAFVIVALLSARTAAAQDPVFPPLPGTEPGVIAGSVHSQDADKVQRATITIRNEKNGETLTATTDDQKNFEFKNVPEGVYSLTVNAEGYARGFRSKVSPGSGPQDFQIRLLMMWEPLSPIFTWAFNTWIGSTVRDSTWAFAYLEVFHLLGLTMLLGSVVALGLRLANIAMRSLPPAEVAQEIRPFMFVGLAIALFSGGLMFAAEAEKLFLSGPFEWKMTFFALANIFQFTAVRKLIRAPEGSNLAVGKFAALLSVLFWYVVAWEGRAIAFF